MNIPKITKRFETSLASSLSASGTTFTTVSATDDDGNALSGLYSVSIDVGNADVEDVIATVSGTTWTIVYRGIDADAPNTEVADNKKAHRRGAPVVITDYPIMGILRNILNGDDTLPNKISYASHPTFSSNTELIDKKYADDLAIAGAPDSSTTVKGLVEKASTAEIDAGTASGGSGPLGVSPDQLAASIYNTRLPSSAQKSALASTTTPGASNLYTTQKDFQKGAELYAADAGSNDTYAITLSPAIAAYTVGQIFRFKANTVNTGAATLNVNAVGALNILRPDGSALADGDIAANQFVEVIVVDASNCRMLSPIANSPKFSHGTTTRAGDAASGTQNIAHGLGRAPRFVRIKAVKAYATDITASSENTYDGTGSGIYIARQSATAQTAGTSASVTIGDAGAITTNQTATITVDATNIILTWTKTGSPNSASINIHWEAIA